MIKDFSHNKAGVRRRAFCVLSTYIYTSTVKKKKKRKKHEICMYVCPFILPAFLQHTMTVHTSKNVLLRSPKTRIVTVHTVCTVSYRPVLYSTVHTYIMNASYSTHLHTLLSLIKISQA